MSQGSAYLLTAYQLKRIRLYVQQKYEHQPDNNQAEIVADAIQRILYRQLPEFSEPIKQQLLQHLVQQIAVNQHRYVTLSDIDTLCVQLLDLSNEHIMHPLTMWREANLSQNKANYEDENLTDIMSESTPYTVLQRIWSKKWTRLQKTIVYSGLSLIMLTAIYVYYQQNQVASIAEEQQITMVAADDTIVEEITASTNELPVHLQYIERDWELLRNFLLTRHSLLAEEPYFSTIINVAEQFDIHPVLLFAITGQEQGFVPTTNKKAETIANNPFNVFHSWQDFNTNITESTEIAARTITRLSKDKPQQMDAVEWINREYAEDPNWASGVNSIFSTIMTYMDQ